MLLLKLIVISNKTKKLFKKLLMIKRCVYYLLSRQIQKLFYELLGPKNSYFEIYFVLKF